MSTQYENNVQQPIFNIHIASGGTLYGGAGVVRSSNFHPTEQHMPKSSTVRAHGGIKASVLGQTLPKPSPHAHPRRQDHRQPSSFRGDAVSDDAGTGWKANASKTGFALVHVRGDEEFAALAEYISNTPYVHTQITTLIFEGVDTAHSSMLDGDTFVSIVHSLKNIQSISLRHIRLHRRISGDMVSPLLHQVRELSMSSVRPVDGQAVVDVLLSVPQLLRLELVDVGEPLDIISGIDLQCNIWEFDVQDTWLHVPPLPALQQLELRSGSGVCLSRFYLNLARCKLDGTNLTALVVSCSNAEDVAALNGLLQCSPSLRHLHIDFSKYFIFGQPSEEEFVHVKHCERLHAVTIHTFLSLMEENHNDLTWACMCAFLNNLPVNEMSHVELHTVVGQAQTDQPEQELRNTLNNLPWSDLERALLRLCSLPRAPDRSVEDLNPGNDVYPTLWFDVPFDEPLSHQFRDFIWNQFQPSLSSHVYIHTFSDNDG